jgi:hypothetical protein
MFQSNDLKWRPFLKARAYSHRYLRAAWAYRANGECKGAKKYLFKAVLFYPPILLRKMVFKPFLLLMLGKSQYDKLKNGVRRLTALLNHSKGIPARGKE